MHNRRFAALLIGGWLMGTVLVWFAASQNLRQVERLLAVPPPEIAMDLAGGDASGRVLRYNAREVNRRLAETWDSLELGIAAALLATAFFTAHRSRTTMLAASLLTATAAASTFYLTPSMNELARWLAFVPAGSAPLQSERLLLLTFWHRVIDVVQLAMALLISARLLFDFYEFRRTFTRDSRTDGHNRRRTSRAAKGPAATDTASS
jgi:hypothetical protein